MKLTHLDIINAVHSEIRDRVKPTPSIGNKGLRFNVSRMSVPTLEEARSAHSPVTSDITIENHIEDMQCWRFELRGYMLFKGDTPRTAYANQFALKRADRHDCKEGVDRLIDRLLLNDAKDACPDEQNMKRVTGFNVQSPEPYFSANDEVIIRLRFNTTKTWYLPIVWERGDPAANLNRLIEKAVNHLMRTRTMLVDTSRYWCNTQDFGAGRYNPHRPIASRSDLHWRIGEDDRLSELSHLRKFIIGKDDGQACRCNEPVRYGEHTSYPDEYITLPTNLGERSTRPPRVTPETMEELLDLIAE